MSTKNQNPSARSKPTKPDRFATAYAKRQRRKAEAIIKATGCYSAAFRAEVQQALDTAAWKLPVLFQEADRIQERLASAGRSIRAEYRKAGIPLRDASTPMKRSPKRTVERLADEIESLMVESENGHLDENWADRAELISDILYDLSNTTEIYSTHPDLVRAYVLATWDKLLSLESRHDYETVQRSFDAIRDLMSGCSEARFEEIDRKWNKQVYKEKERRNEQTTKDIQAESAPELVSARAKLAELENLPENEAVRFQLESEIHRLERETKSADEWPEVIRVQA